jgi:hypothetical protein
MSPRSLPHTVRNDSGGGFVTAFFGVFVLMALNALAGLLIDKAGLAPLVARGACGGLALVILGGLYFFFSIETVATVDGEGLTVTTQSRVGPIRGRLDTIVEVRWSAVPVVYDETRSAITKHGNVQKSYRLNLGGKRFEGALLGTMHRDGRYLELLEAIKLAIGDKLVEREDLGELDGAVRKLVAQQSEARRK